MRAGQVTDNFIPSEVARLVLGYLKETNCMNTWEIFLSESSHLHEYKQLFNEGKEYPTNFNGKSLLEILQYYYTIYLKDSVATNEIKSTVERLENSVSQLKQFLSSESLLPRATKQLSIGCISRQTTLQCVRTHSNIAATSSQRVQQNRNEIRNANQNVSNSNSSERNIRTETQMEIEQQSPNGWNDSSSQLSQITPTSLPFIIENSNNMQNKHFHSNNNCNNNNNVSYVNHCLHNKEIELRTTKSDHTKNISAHNFNSIKTSASTSNNIPLVTVSVVEPQITETCTELSSYEKRNCNNFTKQFSCSSSHSAHCCHHTSSHLVTSTMKEPISSVCENENVFVTQCHQQTCPCVISTGISHNCNFSTCLSSESVNKNASNSFSNSNNLNSPVSHNRNTFALSNTQSCRTPILSRNTIDFSCPSQSDGVNISPRNSIRNTNVTSSSNFDCITRVNFSSSSALNQEVTSCNVGHFSFPSSTHAIENSPTALFSQQRNLLPSLTTPVKDLMEYEDYFRSPKRKSLIPRRRLLSSFSPNICPNSEGENSRKDTGIVSEETNHTEEEMIDFGILMEELINFRPLFEKIAENINKVVSNDHSQQLDTAKLMTDSDVSLSSQESHVPEALIKDILNRTESDPVFEEVLTFLCEKVDSSRDSFENDNQATDVLESVEEPENTELPEKSDQFSSSVILNNANESLKGSNTSNIAQPFQNINKECLDRVNNSSQNCNSDGPVTSVSSNTLQTSSLVINTELPNIQSEINPSTTLSTVVDTNVQTVTNGPSSANVTLANNFVVQPTAMTPIKINVPDFQFLTVSPSHLFGMQTLLSFEQKRTPERVQPIRPKLTDGSSALPSTNSNYILQHRKERTPNGKRPKRQRCIKSKLQKISENTSINQLKTMKNCNSLPSNPSQNKLPAENARLLSPTINANNKLEQMDKTSPQLKSLVTSAQALAGRSNRTSKAHVRVLDFGPEANAANSMTGYVNNSKSNNLVAQVNLPSEIITTNEIQASEDKEIHLGYLNETGELIIYLQNPEILNETVVTVPYSNEITIPAIVTYSTANQNADIVSVVDSSENVNLTNDSEIAETLVSLASSGRNAKKQTQSKQIQQTELNLIKQNFRAILPKKPLKPKQKKSQDKLLQGMDVDKFLSRVHHGE